MGVIDGVTDGVTEGVTEGVVLGVSVGVGVGVTDGSGQHPKVTNDTQEPLDIGNVESAQNVSPGAITVVLTVSPLQSVYDISQASKVDT